MERAWKFKKRLASNEVQKETTTIEQKYIQISTTEKEANQILKKRCKNNKKNRKDLKPEKKYKKMMK